MKVVFSGGGTAGHVNPAMAVAGYICRMEDSRVWLSGGKGNIEERLAAQAGIEIFVFPMKGLSRSISPRGILQNVQALSYAAKATAACGEILERIQPDVVVGTGGYASFPMVRAAYRKGIKTALLEINAAPGMATKRLVPHVDCVMLSYGETKALLPRAKKVVVTGSPVREEIIQSRYKAYEPLFANGLPTVLSFWGSVGAKHMNEKMVDMFALVARERKFNLLHAAGKAAMEWMPKALADRGINLSACDNIDLREYIYDMDRAMAVADLVICRAGGTLAELCVAGKPSVIVPSPFVAGNHQEKNARIMESAGAARVLEEKETTGQQLYDTTMGLLQQPEELAQMGRAALARAKPEALEIIYQTLKALILE